MSPDLLPSCLEPTAHVRLLFCKTIFFAKYLYLFPVMHILDK
jgi:hypothetical protein